MPRFWTCSYDYQTWNARRAGLAAWSERQKLRRQLQPGDLILPYLSRIGWVGIWIATSWPRLAPEESPFGDEFPLVADYEVDFQLDPEEALTTSDIPSPHSLLRMDAGYGSVLPVLFRMSGVELSEPIGQALADELREWAREPKRRKLTAAQTSGGPRAEHVDTDQGPVAIPPAADEADEVVDTEQQMASEDATPVAPVRQHAVVQRKLLELGRRLGLTPWVTPGDRSAPADDAGQPLGEVQGVTTQLPAQFNEATNRTIRYIDVMWLHRSRIEAAFEVENSTSIYSGILRMADLLALQPNIDVPLYLVIPAERLDKAQDELLRPVFQTMQRPLHQVCRILTYDKVDELLGLAEQAGGALKVDVVDQFALWAEHDAAP